MRILVVEDDAGIADLVELALTESGHRVLLAPHGRAALELLERERVDLVLLDMLMPVMNGWEFARAYRERPGPKAPIIVMTAAADAIRRGAEIDSEAVLSKPFGLDELDEVIDRATRGLEAR